MLRIRQEQMEEFNRCEAVKFENRMVEHLEENFPEECEEMGEEAVRETIRYGISRADSYGIEFEQDVCNYVNLMFVLGRDFDTDPGLPWAKRILNDPELDHPTDKMDALYDEAETHLEPEEGTDDDRVAQDL